MFTSCKITHRLESWNENWQCGRSQCPGLRTAAPVSVIDMTTQALSESARQRNGRKRELGHDGGGEKERKGAAEGACSIDGRWGKLCGKMYKRLMRKEETE